MENFLGIGFFIIIVTLIFNTTLEMQEIDLKTVNAMVQKCKENGGVRYIEHDYDITCKNGAEFSSFGVAFRNKNKGE